MPGRLDGRDNGRLRERQLGCRRTYGHYPPLIVRQMFVHCHSDLLQRQALHLLREEIQVERQVVAVDLDQARENLPVAGTASDIGVGQSAFEVIELLLRGAITPEIAEHRFHQSHRFIHELGAGLQSN